MSPGDALGFGSVPVAVPAVPPAAGVPPLLEPPLALLPAVLPVLPPLAGVPPPGNAPPLPAPEPALEPPLLTAPPADPAGVGALLLQPASNAAETKPVSGNEVRSRRTQASRKDGG